MVTNSSSFNASFGPSHPSTADPSYSIYAYCLLTAPSSFIFIAIAINIIVLMLPLSVFILHHGAQQWLQRHSASAAAFSHSDCFTYHMVAMEMLGVFGYILNVAGICRGDFYTIRAGGYCTSLTWFGQMFFHVLTCLERHLAVVHPIVYLRLKNERGIRIRNVGVGCVWALSAVGVTVQMHVDSFSVVDLCLLVLSLIIVSYFSVSVLLVLIRPGPGEPGESKERVGHLRPRAFCTIVAILAVLVIRFACNMVWEVVFMSGKRSGCVLMAVCDWGNVPVSLVLPLLFLHRAGTFTGCRFQSRRQKSLQSSTTTAA